MTPAKQRALVTILVGLGMLIVGVFGLRTIYAFREFRSHRPPPPFETESPATEVELIRDWMTIPYIGKMYRIPSSVIFKALNIPMNKNRDKSIKQLNEEYYRDVQGFVEAKIKQVILGNLPTPIPAIPSVLATSSVPAP